MRFFIIFLSFFSCVYGVVSIAPVEIGKSSGVSGVAELSVANSRGNTEKDEYKAALKVQYDAAAYVTWAEASMNYAQASGVKNTNKTYTHLRYIHTLLEKKELNYELFAQSQTDEFTKVKHRLLGGGGLRYHIFDKMVGKLFVGGGVFYEFINYTTAIDPKENNVRANLYISYAKDLAADSKIGYVGYYQPKLSNFRDYIVTNALELQVHIYQKFFTSIKVSYNFDSKPAIGVKKDDFTQTTSIVYKF